MKFLFVLDSVEAPQAVNPQLGRRLAGQLARFGHVVRLLELWDGQTPPPAPPAGVGMDDRTFNDERLMNAALENGRKGGSPVPLRLAWLAAHPGAAAAAFRQLVLHKPRRQVEAQRAIEALDAAYHFDYVVAVCAPYRAAFALESAAIGAKKVLWQLDPYAANKEYAAPGGAGREAALLSAMAASFITPQALPDYGAGPLAACRDKVHVLEFPSLLRCDTPPARHPQLRCVFCGSLYPALRTPGFALQLFSALAMPGVELVMAGGGWQPFTTEAQAAQRAMRERLSILGPVSPARARELLEGADVLLSIGNAVDNQIPSKIFEYFGLGKPILHLAYTDADPVLPLLQQYPLAFTLRAEDGATELALAALHGWLNDHGRATLPYTEVVRLFPAYTPAAVADKFLDCLL